MGSSTPYLLAVVFHMISFVLCVIAYGTGYWFEATGEERLFKRLGLWETCFDGYEHTSDYIGKAYYGCWWIFHKEYSYIRQWIMPPWFIAVQTLMTFALVFEFLGLAFVPMAAKEASTIRPQTIASVITGSCTVCLGISVTIFGIMVGEDRTWMPRPDIDRLSWSFALAVISGFFAAFSCISISVFLLIRRYELLPEEKPEYAEKGVPQASIIPMKPRVV